MTQNASQHVLTKTFSCQQGHKMHLIMFWPKLSYVSEDTKLISTCVDQTYPMQARTQTGTQHVLNKHNICQRGQKMHLNMCWPTSSLAREDIKSIWTCVYQIQCQRGHKMQHNMCWHTPPMRAMTEMHLNMFWSKLSYVTGDTKFISTCVDQTYPMLARSQNVSIMWWKT